MAGAEGFTRLTRPGLFFLVLTFPKPAMRTGCSHAGVHVRWLLLKLWMTARTDLSCSPCELPYANVECLCPVNFEVESEMETRPELEEVSAPRVTQAAEPSHRSWLSGFTRHFFYTARLVLEELLHCASEIKRVDRDGECIMNMEIFRSPPHPVALICINLYIICVIESSILA